MRPFLGRILICLVPVLASIAVNAWALNRYFNGEGGFKLGVDLVGGTILVYEIDMDKFQDDRARHEFTSAPEKLAEALKRRIDPADLYNVTIRPLGSTRVEIILPTGGTHQARIEEDAWKQVLDKVRAKYPPPEGQTLDVGRGQVQELVAVVKQQHPDVPAGDIQRLVDEHYSQGGRRREVTAEEVQRIKDLIAQVGRLEFRILANEEDDKEVIDATRRYINEAKAGSDVARELQRLAEQGKPPPIPRPEGEEGWRGKDGRGPRTFRYSWVEMGPQERRSLNLDNAAATDDTLVEKQRMAPYHRSGYWHEVAEKRRGVSYEWDAPSNVRKIKRDAQGQPAVRDRGDPIPAMPGPMGRTLMYSRDCTNLRLTEAQRQEKRVEYFILVRDPDPGQEITGDYLTNVRSFSDISTNGQAVGFGFKGKGADLFYEVTSANVPGGSGPEETKFFRHLAIILDGYISSAPRINQAIRDSGQISGNFTLKEAQKLESILRSGALPATLKPFPVSENTMGPTLGSDTIRAGFWSIIWAFLAVLAFMVVYYRFAGLVASVALFANLLLTVAFMVIVQATFTLPGLAGLVLTLGMAVDANILIYERLREERDRGSSLALAIRNAYERAFPTIIDTHLTSIFTAIVLYAVGNDQLKGFGVSLMAGLIISLFTSLYMTRLMFDIWQARGWLTKLSMLRLFTRTNIDFMRVRHYWFAATILLTLFGVSVFLLRGEDSLNIDFLSGTAYSGQLVPGEARTIGDLRRLLDDDRQREVLKVESVKQLDDEGRRFEIVYANPPEPRRLTVNLTEPAVSKEASPAQREAFVKERAEQLPNWSVVQIFPSDERAEGGKSRYFTVRTSERQSDLVQLSINRLMHENRNGEWGSLLKRITLNEVPRLNEGESLVTLRFNDFASPSYVRTLLDREFRQKGVADFDRFDLKGKGRSRESRYEEMELVVSSSPSESAGVDRAKINQALQSFKEEFEARPPTERLENFDKQMALDTQLRALYAILASWLVILLYVWFRFGNWTFGLAAVLCLAHDVLFTLGIIAFCHYIYVYVPWLASILLIQDFKIDLPTVAALLTLVGYSINDKIVVYDRMREVRGKRPELTPQVINESINQALSRTVLTGICVLLVLLVLYIFGGEGIHLFAFVMLIGMIVGTYSSIYIASPLLLIFGEGARAEQRGRPPQPQPAGTPG